MNLRPTGAVSQQQVHRRRTLQGACGPDDPVAAAIAARKCRSEWWSSGDEALSSPASPLAPPQLDAGPMSQDSGLGDLSSGVTIPQISTGLQVGAHRVGWVLVTPEETKALQAALALLRRMQEISQLDMQEMERRWVARVQQLKLSLIHI